MQDPVTGEELTREDLITLQQSPRIAFPRPPTHSSVPSLLTALQNEYDAMVYETVALRKQYDSVRQDLANALYTNDASMRVIARLMKERNDAREALASIHTSLGMPTATSISSSSTTTTSTAPGSATQDVDMTVQGDEQVLPRSLPPAVMEQVDATASQLSSERRARIKRGASAPYPTPATASSMEEREAINAAHRASSPGILALDISANGSLVLTGGQDKSVHVVDRASGQVTAKLQGHSKPITAAVFSGRSNPAVGDAALEAPMPAFAVSASADGSVRTWRRTENDSYELAHVLETYDAPVTGVDVHPTDSLVGSASRDGSWAIHSLENGERLMHVPAPAASDDQGTGYVYESFAFHPDGQLAATGTADGAIRIWDIKQGEQSAVFRGHEGNVHTLSFSQNGYLLVAASRDASHAKVWDLRKLDVTRTIEAAGSGIESVRLDASAQLLAVVGRDVRVFGGKSFELCATWDAASCTCAQWSPSDGALLVGSLDRSVRVFVSS